MLFDVPKKHREVDAENVKIVKVDEIRLKGLQVTNQFSGSAFGIAAIPAQRAPQCVVNAVFKKIRGSTPGTFRKEFLKK